MTMADALALSTVHTTLRPLTTRAVAMTSAATHLIDASSTTISPTNPPSLSFSRAFAWCEMLLLVSAVLVLSVAMIMMGRMYTVFSTPTKTMVCMVAANMLGAVVSLVQSFHLLSHLNQGHFLPSDDAFCAASHPVSEGLEAVTWWGHVLLAFMTWQTIHGRRTGRRAFNILLYAVPVGIGILATVGMELQAPGEVMWGLFCVTPFLVGSAKKHADVRWFRGVFCQITLALSIVLYIHGYWTLWQKSNVVSRSRPHRNDSSNEGNTALPAPTPQELQAARLRRATKALLHRSVLILVAYYLPYVIIHCVLSIFQSHPPADASPRFLALFFVAFVFGQPVLQSFIFIYAAVSVGHNLLHGSKPSHKPPKQQNQRQRQQKQQQLQQQHQQEQQQQAGASSKEVMASRWYVADASLAAGATLKRTGQRVEPEIMMERGDAVVDECNRKEEPRARKGCSKEGSTHATGAGGEKVEEVTVDVPSSATITIAPSTGSSTGAITTGKTRIFLRRSFHDPHRGHTRTRSREQVQVLATIYEVAFKKGRAKNLHQDLQLAGQGAEAGTGLRACPAEREASSLVQEYLGREAMPDVGEEEGDSSSNSSGGGNISSNATAGAPSSSWQLPLETLEVLTAEREEEGELEEGGSGTKEREGRINDEDGDLFADLDDGGRETIFDDGEGEPYAVEIKRRKT